MTEVKTAGEESKIPRRRGHAEITLHHAQQIYLGWSVLQGQLPKWQLGYVAGMSRGVLEDEGVSEGENR
jgi:hypothetical protein